MRRKTKVRRLLHDICDIFAESFLYTLKRSRD